MYMLAHLIEDREQLRLLITTVLLLQVRKKTFWRHSIQQTEYLSRQARDKHWLETR